MAHRAARAKTEIERLKFMVAAVAVYVQRDSREPAHRASATKIRIEGQSDGVTAKVSRETLLLVSSNNEEMKVSGYAIGGKTPWTVSCSLPREQFADLLAVVLADRLKSVEMDFDRIHWHKGTLLSVEFATRPLPSEAD